MLRMLVLLAAALLASNAYAGTFQLHAAGPLTVRNSFHGFGCTGQNLAPSLRWSNPPANTRSFAVTVYDPDAPTGSGWWHWVVIDLPAATRQLSNGQLPVGAHGVHNDYGLTGWGGPCPPAGDKPHHYLFTVYALDVPSLDLPPNATAAFAGFAIHMHMLGKAQDTLRYGR